MAEPTALVIDQQIDARIEEEMSKLEVAEEVRGVDEVPSIDAPASAAARLESTPPTRASMPRPRAAPNGTHQEMAASIVQFLTVNSVAPIFTRGEVWQYNGAEGAWKVVSSDTLKKLVTGYDLQPVGQKNFIRVTNALVESVVKLVHTAIADRAALDAAVVGFAFKNGFVVVDACGIKLKAHSPEHRVTSTNGVTYDPRARRWRWLRFLIGVFQFDPDRKAKIRFIQEFIGACLLGIAPHYEFVLVLLGEGSNGKSILMDVMKALFPPSTLSAVPPQQWGQDYKKADLANARLNAVAELPGRAILDSADFKAIVTGELVSARQPYAPAFNFACRAGHIFLANSLPATPDLSHGFWRRFVVIKFNRKFVPGSPTTSKHQAPAKGRCTMIAELTAELPGIWAWALEGARNLLVRGRFEVPDSHSAVMAEWRRNTDPVQDFIESCCSPAGESETWARSRALYKTYRRWAEAAGHRQPLKERTFATRLAASAHKRHDNRGASYELVVLPDEEWRGGDG